MLGDLTDVNRQPTFVADDFPSPGLGFADVVRFKPPRDAFPVEMLRYFEAVATGTPAPPRVTTAPPPEATVPAVQERETT